MRAQLGAVIKNLNGSFDLNSDHSSSTREDASTKQKDQGGNNKDLHKDTLSAQNDWFWQISADQWLLRSAFEKHKKLLAEAEEKQFRAQQVPTNMQQHNQLHNYSLDSEEEIFDARRAALSRITAAARANGLAIAREFQKLQKAYNRGYNAMYADESSYMFCEDNIEDDEDYGPRRKRKRAAGKNINSYDSDTARDENSGRKFYDNEDLQSGRQAACQPDRQDLPPK